MLHTHTHIQLEGNYYFVKLKKKPHTITCGIRNKRNRFATWIEVTDEAAPTTPDMTLRTWVLLQWYSAPSMLLIDPENKIKQHIRFRISLPDSFALIVTGGGGALSCLVENELYNFTKFYFVSLTLYIHIDRYQMGTYNAEIKVVVIFT